MSEGRLKDDRLVVDFLQATAALRREIKGRNETVRFKKNDEGFVIYAVDSDIIKCFTTPRSLATQASYGIVFPDDESDEDLSTGVVHSLAKYIFYDLEPNWPIFQLPTHYSETKTVYNAVALDAFRHSVTRKEKLALIDQEKNEDQSVSKRALIQLVQTYLETKNSTNKSIDELARPIFEVIQKSVGYSKELSRYFSLQSTGCAVSLTHGKSVFSRDKEMEGVVDAFDGAFTRRGNEFDRYHRLVRLWQVRLEGQKNSKRRFELIQNDAEALASLDIINGRLSKIGGKMILITGDRSLIAASRDVVPYGEEKHFGHDYFVNFARRNIRHIHSFVSDCFVEGGNGSYNSVENWLDGFLGKFSNALRFDDQEMHKIAVNRDYATSLIKNQSITQKDIEELLDDWTDFRSLSLKASFILESQKETDGLYAAISESLKLVNDITDAKEIVTEISLVIAREKSKIWEAFVLDLCQAGTDFLFSSGSMPQRNAPNVTFGSLDKANIVFEKLQAGQYWDKPEEFDSDIEGLSQNTNNEIPGQNALGYIYYLIFAGAFSQASKWSVALSLACRALDIIEDVGPIKYIVQGKPIIISGREANYMAAISSRVIAKNSRGLQLSRDFLDAAKLNLIEDKDENGAEGIEGIRINIEEISLNLSEIYINSFVEAKRDSPTLDQDLIDSLLLSGRELLSVCAKRERTGLGLKFNNSMSIIAVNCLQLMSLKIEISKIKIVDISTKDIELIKQCFEALRVHSSEISNEDLVEKHNRSYLIQTYFLFGGKLLGYNVDLFPHFSPQKIKEMSVTVYDEKRFEWLIGLIEKL